ncbi:MAG: hypothetical protein QNK36_04665 [Colwellia sp.]|nr:hypothetical protein [Colwellia sp.]
MLEQNNNSSEQNTTQQEVNASATSARRSFLKKAAIGAPIVIASSTKPAWGAACMSGIMSGNVSDHTHTCNLAGGETSDILLNSFVGGQDSHWTSGTQPATWWAKDDEVKATLRPYFKCYYAPLPDETVDPTEFSIYKNNLPLPTITGKTFRQALKDGTPYQSELAAAFINASLLSLNYPYSIADVEEIAMAVLAGDATAEKVAEMLNKIHTT